MRIYSQLCYTETNDPAHYMNLYLPDAGDSFPVFVYYHGGGLIHGNEDIGTHWTKYLTDRGIAVVSANYHLYPSSKGQRNVKFPMFLEDAADAVAWVKDHIEEYCKMESLFVGGSSSGAYLSAMLCFDKRWLGRHGMSPMDIDGFVHDSAQLTTHFSVLDEKGLANSRVIVDENAPLFYVGTESDYPPMLFINAENDGHTRLSQTKLAVTALNNLGHKAPKIQSVVFTGSHCSYVNDRDWEDGNVFGFTVLDFIRSI